MISTGAKILNHVLNWINLRLIRASTVRRLEEMLEEHQLEIKGLQARCVDNQSHITSRDKELAVARARQDEQSGMISEPKAEVRAICSDVREGPIEKQTQWLYNLLIHRYEDLQKSCNNLLTDEQVQHLSQLMLVVAARNCFATRDNKIAIYRAAEEFGVHFLPTHFYSPLPTIREIDPKTYGMEYSGIPGLVFDPIAHRRIIGQLGRYARELADIPCEVDEGDGPQASFCWKNPAFNSTDASLYYGMIRRFQPSRILEVGSGYSTLIAERAIEKNGAGRIDCIDPYPLPFLDHLAKESRIRLIPTAVQEVNHEHFDALEKDDILFIDSTHVCKIGSDLNYLLFKVVPFLNRGVLIHFHDIFLPWEYPREWIEDLNIFWNEQYLLMAFMAYNRDYEILLSAQYAGRRLQDLLREEFSDVADPLVGGGSFWLRKL